MNMEGQNRFSSLDDAQNSSSQSEDGQNIVKSSYENLGSTATSLLEKQQPDSSSSPSEGIALDKTDFTIYNAAESTPTSEKLKGRFEFKPILNF